MNLCQNTGMLRLETHRSSTVALHEHVRANKVLDFSLTSLFKVNTLRRRAREDTSLMHHLGKLSGQILPCNSASFQHIETTVRRTLGGALGCNVGDFDEEVDEVQNVTLQELVQVTDIE